MPTLETAFGLNGEINPADCYQINMDDWGYSNSRPLGTTGAGPCLNVVVHRNNQGCLTHIHNSSLDQTENFHKACFTIRDMILCIGHLTHLDIWLGAGHAFGPNPMWGPHGMASMDFCSYLAAFLDEMGCTHVNINDNRAPGPITYWDPGCLVYSPPLGKVFLLSNRDNHDWENGVHAIQTGNKPPRRGIAH